MPSCLHSYFCYAETNFLSTKFQGEMQGKKCYCMLQLSISYVMCPPQNPTAQMHLCVPNLCLILNRVSLKHVRRKYNGFLGYSFGIQSSTALQGFFLSGSACSCVNLPVCCDDAIKTHEPSAFLKSSCLDLFPC